MGRLVRAPFGLVATNALAAEWVETSARVAVLAVACAVAFGLATIVVAVLEERAVRRGERKPRESHHETEIARAQPASGRSPSSPADDVEHPAGAGEEQTALVQDPVVTATPPLPAAAASGPQNGPAPAKGGLGGGSSDRAEHLREEAESTLVLEFASTGGAARGRFGVFHAAFDGGPGMDDLRVSVVVDATSVDAGDSRTNADLRSLLDVDRYPELRFESTSIRSVGSALYRVTGLLTIRGRTREVAMDAAVEAIARGSSRADHARVLVRGSFPEKDFDLASADSSAAEVKIFGDAVAVREA